MNVNIYRGNLEACRVCLATDIKLISLQNKHLKHIYSEFSGVPMMVTDGLPQHICVYCCALLKKCFKFKQKCYDTNNILRLYLLEMHALTTSFINTLYRSHLRIPLTITDPLECHCIPEPDINTEVTVENAIKTKTISISDDDPESINGLDNNSNQDCDDVLENNELMPDNEESKCLEEASEAANTGDDEKQEQKDNLNSEDKILTDDEERVEDFKNTYCNKYMHSDKESFYLFILEKYLKKSKSFTYNDLLLLGSNLGDNTTEIPALISTEYDIIDYSREEVKSTIKLCNSTQNIHQKRFYEFINYRYVNNSDIICTIRQKIVIDIDNMDQPYVPKKGTITKDSLAKLSKEFNVDVKLLLKEEKVQDFLKRKETDKYKNAKYKCELCYTGFAHEKTFQNHKAIHDPSTGPYECALCQVRFKSAIRLRSHFGFMHTYKFICRECGRISRDSSLAREHHRTHSGLKYTCEHCNQTFNTYKARLKHIQLHHGSVSCDICHMKFTNESGLIIHKTKAHRALFKCAMCLVSFHNGNALRRHKELTVTGCGTHMKYVRGSPMHEHTKTHTSERRFQCAHCHCTFRLKGQIIAHLRVHSDERPFPCPICHKRFKARDTMQFHMRTVHEGQPTKKRVRKRKAAGNNKQ